MLKKQLKETEFKETEMESVRNTLAQYESTLASTLMDSTRFRHTHPPILGIEVSCLYCRLHGNVFENGVKETNSDELCHYIVPITNAQEMTLLK